MSGGQDMSTEVLVYVLRLSFGASLSLLFLLVFLVVGDFQTPSRAPPLFHPSSFNYDHHFNKDENNVYSKS